MNSADDDKDALEQIKDNANPTVIAKGNPKGIFDDDRVKKHKIEQSKSSATDTKFLKDVDARLKILIEKNQE